MTNEETGVCDFNYLKCFLNINCACIYSKSRGQVPPCLNVRAPMNIHRLHVPALRISTRVPLLPALSRQVMKPGYCTEDCSSSQALGCVNVCGVYNVSEQT